MKITRKIAYVMLGIAVWMASTSARGQVVINELVDDEQDFDSTVDISPDTREFVELYNAGNSAVDITGWTLGTVDLATGLPVTTDAIPSGVIPAHGYYVIGNASVPNVNFTPAAGELWNNFNTVFELRNPNLTGSTLVDALGVETFRGVELLNATQEQLDQIAVGQTVGATATGGWWGQIESNNAGADPNLPNLPMSIGRYLDGRDTNKNGRDFGMVPATPGATNNLALVSVHDVTNVDAVAVGSVMRNDYYASFKLPRVITPGTVDTYNPNSIPASPQGGRAIIAWDETGGGNAVYSDEYSNEFKIYAYIDPRPFNVTTADTTQSEASVYGIGTTDMFFGTPNSGDLLTGQPGTGGNITSSANGSTGLGWLIQRRTSNTAGTQASKAILQLLDMNDGGDGVLADNDWQVKQSIDLTGLSAGWHVLGIKYDPTTGNVVATYDGQTFNFASQSNLVGNFYIGYREQLPGTSGSGTARPPTYDLFVPTGLAGDYNGNGKVDGADYVVWRNGGAPDSTVAGYNLWRLHFGEGSGSGAGAVGGAVPEPASLALVAVGLMAVCGRRRVVAR